MTGMPDITVALILHHEGAFALPALASLGDLVAVARAAGLAVETQAILDRVDESTKYIVSVRGRWIDTVAEVSFGDLGLSRNAGTHLAHGRFLAFLDGDDLWGEQWLRAAFDAATTPHMRQDVIWHPEHLYTFRETEPARMSEAAHSRFQSSEAPDFNPLSLGFANLWSANAFAPRNLYVRFPYCAADRNKGLGIDDWSWNLASFSAGIPHRVVPGTVHLIRIKASGSLDRQNAADHLLPHLPDSLRWGEKWP
jgi:hypothetical protein